MYGGLVLMTIPGEELRMSIPAPEASPTFMFIMQGVISRMPVAKVADGTEEGIEPVEALLSLSGGAPGARPTPRLLAFETLGSSEGLALRLLCMPGAVMGGEALLIVGLLPGAA
jgi:hypothetical protein